MLRTASCLLRSAPLLSLLLFSPGALVTRCNANPDCQSQYSYGGSSGDCSWEFEQLFCGNSYCEVFVRTCETESGFRAESSYYCY